MMQVNIKHIFSSVSQVVIFKKLCDVEGTLANIVPFTRFFYDVHPSLYYQHGQNVEGVTIIESSSSTKQGDPLGGPLFVLAHYRTFLETITQAPNYIFPSLTDDTHIMGPKNEITYAFDHLSTQLTLIGFRVKMQALKSIRDLSRHRNS